MGSWRRRSRASRARGRALRTAALVVVIVGLAVTFALGALVHGQALAELVTVAAGVPFYAVGYLLTRRSRRHFSLTADDVRAQDDRPPVVYLRSFNEDKANDQVDVDRITRFRAVDWAMQIALLGPFRLAQEWFGQSEEECWASAMDRLGPMIAIGAPGQLPFRGAARLYVGDDEWQTIVMDLVQEAALVAVLAGVTEGLWWEITQVAKTVPRERLIFLLPRDSARYARFREGIKQEIGVEVGDQPRVSHDREICGILRFARGGEAEVVPVWGSSQASVEIALEPVFKALAASDG